MSRRQTDILKQPIPTLLVTFAVLLTIQTLRAIGTPYGVESLSGFLSPLGELIDTSLGYYGGIVVVLLCVVVASIIITRIISRYSLSVIRSLVPMVLFIVGVCGVLFPIGSPSAMLALLMSIHATDLMIMSFRRTERFSEVMRAAFWSGCATLLIPDMVYPLLLLPLQWLIWQRSPREMVAGVIMALVPLLPTSFGWWVAGEKPLWFVGEWSSRITLLHTPSLSPLLHSSIGIGSKLLLGVLVVLCVASVAVYLSGFSSMRLRARKGHIYFTALYTVGLLMLLCGCSPAIAIPLMGYASVPLIHTFFVRRKGMMSATIYIIIVLLSLAASLTMVL